MHAICRTAAVFGLAGLVGWSVAAAAQQSMTLPDVNVAAPSTRSGAASAGGMPFFGDTRVEEEKWPVIPCAASRVGASTAGICRRGPSVMNFEHGDAQGNRQMSNCEIAHDLVIGTLGGLQFEADSLVFDPYYVSAIGHQRQDCYVESVPVHLPAQFADMNEMTRRASRWGNLVDGGDLITMAFSVGADGCLAFEKRGPRWGGGYTYLIHASICRKDGQPVDARSIAAVLATLQVRQRDAAGNLRQ